MRRLIGHAATLAAMAMASAAVAQPAHPSELSVGLTDLASAMPTTAGSGGAAATAPAPITMRLAGLGAGIAEDPAAAADFRLHALTKVLPAQPASPLDNQKAKLRRGFGGAMADFFPLGIDGFHISGGTRFYSRGPARAGVVDARGLVDMRYVTLLYAPRSVLARASRRMTPALTMGFTRLLQGGLSLGIEGGAMLGKFDSLAGSLVRPPRLRGAGLGDGAGQLNQVARMTFGYHF